MEQLYLHCQNCEPINLGYEYTYEELTREQFCNKVDSSAMVKVVFNKKCKPCFNKYPKYIDHITNRTNISGVYEDWHYTDTLYKCEIVNACYLKEHYGFYIEYSNDRFICYEMYDINEEVISYEEFIEKIKDGSIIRINLNEDECNEKFNDIITKNNFAFIQLNADFTLDGDNFYLIKKLILTKSAIK
jgi:hypothetical protein